MAQDTAFGKCVRDIVLCCKSAGDFSNSCTRKSTYVRQVMAQDTPFGKCVRERTLNYFAEM